MHKMLNDIQLNNSWLLIKFSLVQMHSQKNSRECQVKLDSRIELFLLNILIAERYLIDVFSRDVIDEVWRTTLTTNKWLLF